MTKIILANFYAEHVEFTIVGQNFISGILWKTDV